MAHRRVLSFSTADGPHNRFLFSSSLALLLCHLSTYVLKFGARMPICSPVCCCWTLVFTVGALYVTFASVHCSCDSHSLCHTDSSVIRAGNCCTYLEQRESHERNHGGRTWGHDGNQWKFWYMNNIMQHLGSQKWALNRGTENEIPKSEAVSSHLGPIA